MKKLLTLFAVILFVVACNAQPKTDYEIATPTIAGVTQYHFFLEKKSASPYKLTEDMDYLSPDVTTLKLGVSSSSVWTINLPNDGSEYKVGVVLENSGGYYSGMSTAVGVVGTVPVKPASVIFRKKN